MALSGCGGQLDGMTACKVPDFGPLGTLSGCHSLGDSADLALF